MSYPSAPPPYDDKNPLYPPQPGGYPGGYPQPGGYPHPGPGHVPAVPVFGGGSGEEDGLRASTWDDKSVRHTFIRKVTPEGGRVPAPRGCRVGIWGWEVWGGAPSRLWPQGTGCGWWGDWYKTEAVLITMVITAIVAIIVTVFCFQTKVDFTSCTGLFCVLGIVVTVTGIITAIVLSFTYVKWLHMLYAAIGAIVFTLFLAYNTQLVLGNRKNAISPEEYVYGAMEIYMNIVQIFIFLLQIVGRS
uniref:Transmembrane BAX inhibitor motif containing 1 n=1 Tax=Chelonoidis abingdonii TaxID=106734 RepID=A0A8C0GQ32_CHEAB